MGGTAIPIDELSVGQILDDNANACPDEVLEYVTDPARTYLRLSSDCATPFSLAPGAECNLDIDVLPGPRFIGRLRVSGSGKVIGNFTINRGP